MGIEIERKWLLNSLPEGIESMECREIEQGYLNFSPVIRVRKDVRHGKEKYELTYKGGGLLLHQEENLPLDRESYGRLRSKCEGKLLRKKRYMLPLGRYTAELDVFQGELSGLFLVEVEFPTAEEARAFSAPDWFGEEVTESGLYSNARMARLGRKALEGRRAQEEIFYP